MTNIVKELQRHLPKEITAHTRYAGHASLIRFHGYVKLAEKYAEEAQEEREHADLVMWRLQELGVMPGYIPQLEGAPLNKWDIRALLSSDLAFEISVLNSLTACNDCAEHDSDYASSQLLRKLIDATQDHVTWLKTNLALMDELGAQNYLQAWV